MKDALVQKFNQKELAFKVKIMLMQLKNYYLTEIVHCPYRNRIQNNCQLINIKKHSNNELLILCIKRIKILVQYFYFLFNT